MITIYAGEEIRIQCETPEQAAALIRTLQGAQEPTRARPTPRAPTQAARSRRAPARPAGVVNQRVVKAGKKGGRPPGKLANACMARLKSGKSYTVEDIAMELYGKAGGQQKNIVRGAFRRLVKNGVAVASGKTWKLR